MPKGARCIIRREPWHQWAQRTPHPSFDSRYWGFYTDCRRTPGELDQLMRKHAHAENHIARLKDAGLCRMPFTSFEANSAWLMTVGLSVDPVRSFQLCCLDGRWRTARPKAMRWELFHAPGRLVRHSRQTIVRILEHWPTAEAA